MPVQFKDSTKKAVKAEQEVSGKPEKAKKLTKAQIAAQVQDSFWQDEDKERDLNALVGELWVSSMSKTQKQHLFCAFAAYENDERDYDVAKSEMQKQIRAALMMS